MYRFLSIAAVLLVTAAVLGEPLRPEQKKTAQPSRLGTVTTLDEFCSAEYASCDLNDDGGSGTGWGSGGSCVKSACWYCPNWETLCGQTNSWDGPKYCECSTGNCSSLKGSCTIR